MLEIITDELLGKGIKRETIYLLESDENIIKKLEEQ